METTKTSSQIVVKRHWPKAEKGKGRVDMLRKQNLGSASRTSRVPDTAVAWLQEVFELQ